MTGGLVKGIISSVSGTEAEVSLPEYDDAVTAPIPILQYDRYIKIGDMEYAVKERYHIGQWVVVALFSDDFNDGVIIT